MPLTRQRSLFVLEPEPTVVNEATSTTFLNNLRLPVHRWIRYSAGFSAEWVQSVIREQRGFGDVRLFDPFAGCGTSLLAAEQLGIPSCGMEAHPFVARMADAKLAWRSDPDLLRTHAKGVADAAKGMVPSLADYPKLIRECYDDVTLNTLDRLRRAASALDDGSPAARLVWLALTAILRKCSHAGTAQWQYVLPKKSKSSPSSPDAAFREQVRMMSRDMLDFADRASPVAHLIQGDARTCDSVADRSANLVITSPPYPNNDDYADATRLEMCFFGELKSWGELQSKVRRHLLRSCSQHVPERTVNLDGILGDPLLEPIRSEITDVCQEMAKVRLTKGGRKTYHLMVACYFLDLARVWQALRRVCDSPSQVCFVVGDSAPYGVYVPVIEWLGRLAVAAGFSEYRFDRTRDRNVKWKNRKHRVPLCEGRLWVQG